MTIDAKARELFPYNANAGRDHLAWAKRILYRESNGDKTLTSLQVRFAREAMNQPQQQGA